MIEVLIQFFETHNDAFIALAVALGSLVGIFLVQAIVSSRFKDKDSPLRRGLVRYFFPALYIAALYGASSFISLETEISRATNVAFVVIAGFLAVRLVIEVVRSFLRRQLSRQDERTGVDPDAYRAVLGLVGPLVWTLGGLIVLENLGVEVSTIIAGLGVGGIAVALAGQAVLKDLFSYLVIVLDRPFATGDFVIFGSRLGTVERIGLRSVRVRSLSGELLVVPTSQMVDEVLQNYRDMSERRVVLPVALAVDGPAEQLPVFRAKLEEAVKSVDGLRFDRLHLSGMTERYSFELVYYVLSGDYAVHMDLQQKVLFRAIEIASELGLRPAQDVRTIELRGRIRSTRASN